MWTNRLSWWALAAMGTVAVAGCHVLGDLSGVAFEDVTEASGGGANLGAAGGPACELASAPRHPGSVSEEADLDDIVLAVRWIDLGEDFDPATGPHVGYDLDGRCSCEPACRTGRPAPSCDGPAGRDNQLAHLFGTLGTASASSAVLAHQAELGSWSVLIRIRGYNGQANDATVQVALMAARPFEESGCNTAPPAWDGMDHWPLSAASLHAAAPTPSCDNVDPDALDPRVVDDSAYVTDGVLVANATGAHFPIEGAGFGMQFDVGVGFATGRLTKNAGQWRLSDGVLAGRLATQEMLEVVATIQLGDDRLCPNHPLYAVIEDEVCSGADLTTQSAADFPCDAYSFGMALNAQEARLGPIRADEPPAECTSPVPNEACANP